MITEARQANWQLIQHLFEQAIELPQAEIAEFLAEACAGRSELQKEVQGLLDAFQGGKDKLECYSILRQSAETTLPEFEGYELLSEIHRGGQGTVFRAIQLSTKREVAIKLMHAGFLAGDEAKRRFEREVELVGSLRHPGIVPIFDSGLATDKYFYAMEFVEGVHLDDYVKTNELSINETLELFVRICEAIGHAQQRGVVHRDLKPSNILIESNGRPRILDFGLAKSLSGEMQSRQTVSMTGQVMGTLAYMSPEQASGARDEIDTRTDVYALGVVLFELLTGELPYELDFTLAENLSAISHQEPDTQILKRNRIGGELSTLLLKALQKEKGRRYESAGAMGEDISRYLGGEPIEAKRDSSLYVIRKVLSRNYRTAVAGSVTLVIILVSSIVSFALYLQADDALKQASRNATLYETQRDELRLVSDESRAQLYIAEMNLAGQSLMSAGGIGMMKELTEKWRSTADRDFRDWEWYFLRSHSDREALIHEHVCDVWCLKLDPEGKRVALGCNSGHVAVWTPETGEHYRIGGIGRQVRGVDWNCDGTLLAACGPSDFVKVWRLEDGATLAELPYEGKVLAVAWHPADQDTLAYADIDGRVHVWNVATKTLLANWDAGKGIQSIRWSEDATTLTFACLDRCVRVWELDPPKIVREYNTFDRPVYGAERQPDGDIVAVCDSGGGVYAVDANSGEVLWNLGTDRMNTSLVWNPNGKQFATVGKDRVVRIFDASSGVQEGRFDGHTDAIWGLDWSADGQTIATASHDHTIRLWKPGESSLDRSKRIRPSVSSCVVMSVEWHPRGEALAVAGYTYDTLLLDPSTLELKHELKGRKAVAEQVQWSPSGDFVAVAGHDAMVTIWDAESREIVQQFREHDPAENRVMSIRWSPDGKSIASGDWLGQVFIWEVAKG
ncbi:MAG: protein kinase, partial [Planctomycetota bacterium]